MSTNKKKAGAKSKRADPSIIVGPMYMEADRSADEQRKAACICKREKTTVRCGRCGNLTFGRTYRVCTTHKNVVFLYDLRNCSKCHGCLKELEELPIDFNTYQKLVGNISKPIE